MFENSGDAVKPKSGGQPMPPGFALHSVADIEEPPEYVLPHFFSDDPTETIPRITRETMLEVLDGKYNEHFDHKMIIDCRFEYEYEGGHINGAINYNDKELLATQLVDTPIEGRTLLIFHCEYSVHRAPIMARHIRSKDREANVEQYPKLTYPEVYILDGGYSAFFAEHPERCYPQAYVEMNAAEHVNTCERELGRLRQNRKGLGRAQTYAFGQQDPTLLDSPTGPSRLGTRESDLSSMLGSSPIGTDRAYARRMVSF
jgi:M-phase inducer tyrosine phosphatase